MASKEPTRGDPTSTRRPWWSWFLVLVPVVALWLFITAMSPDTHSRLAYSTFLARVENDQVVMVEIHNSCGCLDVIPTSGERYRVQGPPGGLNDADLALLDAHGVRRNYEAESSNWLGTLALYLAPAALIVIGLVWLGRRSRGPLSGMASFGRSKARIHDIDATGTTLLDVAGYDAVKEDVGEVVDFLRNPDRYRRIGAQLPKGALLVGPPGTGKTLLARAIAGEAGVPFISVTGSEFLELFVGVGAARVRDLFATAREKAPAIVFVDEIDAIGRRRNASIAGGQDERDQTLNQLLAEMDGFEPTAGIVVLAATNRPDILDPALLRAGRFDRQIVVPLPTQAERAAVLRVHCAGKQLADDVDLDRVARGTPGMSGAELANLVNEAALRAARRSSDLISAADLDAARDRVLLGLPRTTLALTDRDRRVIAHHEAGHAVLAHLLPHADPVHKVTILPTGIALGVTQQLPERERYVRQRCDLEDTIAVRLGGRAAEALVFDTVSTGAHDDLVGATELARRMVREWGMSERLGHLAWGSDGAGFLGEDGVRRDYSDETARVIDEETARILDQQARRARDVLERHRKVLDAVADALLDRETLEAEELEAVIDQAGARPAAAVFGG